MMNPLSSDYIVRNWTVLTLALFAVLGACGGRTAVTQPNTTQSRKQTGTEGAMSHPYSPKPGDEKLARGTVTIDKVTSANAPAAGAIVLTIVGSLPTPCHELRLLVAPGQPAGGVIRIEAWSVTDPDRMCAQVLHPFAVQVPVQAAADSKVAINGTPYGSIRP